MSDKFDTDAIIAATDLVALVNRYIPLQKVGPEYKGICPWHGDSKPSFYVNEKKRLFGCHPCGIHGNAITFLMEHLGIDFVAACKMLTGQDGDMPPPRDIPPRVLLKPPPRRNFAAPASAPLGLADMARKTGPAITARPYLDAQGGLVGFAVDYADGMRYWTYGNRSDNDPAKWEPIGFTAPRPLYGLMALGRYPKRKVLLFGSERTADAGEALFPDYACMSWPGDIESANWPQLAERICILIPDASEAGRQTMERIAAYLHENGAAQVKGVDTSTLPDGPTPDGWTVADAIDWSPKQAMAWAVDRVMVYPKPGTPKPIPKPILANPDIPLNAPEMAPAAPDAPTHTESPQKPATARQSKPNLQIVEGSAVRKPKIQEIEAEAELPPEFSEAGMAAGFVEAHGEDWRYTAQWSAWHRWDGVTWVYDEKNSITWAIRDYCRVAQSKARDLTPTQKNRICTLKNFNAINTLSGSDPECATATSEWDSNPMMLGTPGGVIDLTVGKLIESERDQLISRKTSVSPAEGQHPWWDAVLLRAHKGDPATASFIHRWCGYMLTGDTREERFLFIHGPGGGGKSKFITPLVDIMGDYCRTAGIETFTAKDHNAHPEEWARLAGARIVTAAETEDGTRWNESKIKQATGRDKISARHMHKSTFEYLPQFKLLFVGNHKPALRSVGEEMRRRIDLVEWSGSIPDEDRILDLPDRLKAEYPAILHWMIQGCLEWQINGLGRPATVATATDEYLTGEDTIGAWIDDCVELRDGYRSASAELYGSFKRWADKTGEYAPSQKRFSQKLEDRGFTKYRNASGRGFVGVAVKSDDMIPDSRYPDR